MIADRLATPIVVQPTGEAWLPRLLAAVKRPKVFGPIAALLLLLAAALYWIFGASSAASYVTAPVTRGAVARAVTATGSINPVLTVTVGSYVSGVIQQIDCDFNTKVRKGQLCARIDPRPYESIVAQNRAGVASARAQLLKDQADLAYAAVNARRYSNLLAQHATSGDAHDVAVNQLAQARAQVALDSAALTQRLAVLDAALVNLGYTNIVSPVDGTVVSRNVTVGQTVAASFQTPTLFLIATDLAKMQVDANVSEGDVGTIHAGDPVEFRVEAFADRVFKGVVIQVRQAPQTVQNVVTYDVIVSADNPQLLLKPGMTATVRIITQKRDHVLRVPDLALRYVPGGVAAASDATGTPLPQVWVLRDGRAARVTVRAGLDDDSFTEITSGELAEGDRVIVSERSGAGTASRRSGTAPSSLRAP